MNLKIITPDGIVLEKTADSITLPTQLGEITILPNHMPLVSIITPGEIIVRRDGQENYLSVSNGILELNKNSVHILVDTAETVETLIEEEILKAKERAEKLLQEKRAVADVSYAEAAAALERELVRLKVYERRRKGRMPSVGRES